MINYSWNVDDCVCYPSYEGESDVVYRVNYCLIGVDDSNQNDKGIYYSSDSWGIANLDVSDLSNFIPWADLTESIVQGWVESTIGQEVILQMKSDIESNINEQINPSSVNKELGS
jgi:hypothetical protein